MNKTLIKTISIILVTAILFSLIIGVNAYSVNVYSDLSYTNRIRLVKYNNQAYLLSYDSNTLRIDGVFPAKSSEYVTLTNTILDYNLYNDTVVIACKSSTFNQTEVVLYNLKQKDIKSFNLLNFRFNDISQIVYSAGYIYCTNRDNQILKFGASGKYIQTYDFQENIINLMCSANGTVYALSDYGLNKLSGNKFAKISNNSFFSKGNFICDDVYIDGDGSLYQVKNNVTSFTKFKSDVNIPSGGVCNNYVIASQSNTIYALSKADGLKKKTCSLNNHIEQLCVVDNNIIALTYSGNSPVINVIKSSELQEIKTQTNGVVVNPDNVVTSHISSDTYIVDNTNYKITEIPHSTTVAQFKRNMSYEGYNVEFTRFDGRTLKSGNVGTATIARFYNDHASYEYELSVLGDLTGEGNVNSRDFRIICAYIVEYVTFNGVYIDSANIHKKYPEIDIADVILLFRLYH